MSDIHDAISAEAKAARDKYRLPFENIKVAEERGGAAWTVSCFGEWGFGATMDDACLDLAQRIATPGVIAKAKRDRAALLIAEAELIEKAKKA